MKQEQARSVHSTTEGLGQRRPEVPISSNPPSLPAHGCRDPERETLSPVMAFYLYTLGSATIFPTQPPYPSDSYRHHSVKLAWQNMKHRLCTSARKPIGPNRHFRGHSGAAIRLFVRRATTCRQAAERRYKAHDTTAPHGPRKTRCLSHDCRTSLTKAFWPLPLLLTTTSHLTRWLTGPRSHMFLLKPTWVNPILEGEIVFRVLGHNLALWHVRPKPLFNRKMTVAGQMLPRALGN